MTELFRFIFNYITDPLSLPIAWYWEYLIMLVIGEIAYRVAYSKVSALYRLGDISGKGAGSFLHWVIRLGYFVAIWAAIRLVIVVGKFLIANWLLVLGLLFAFGLVIYSIESLQKELNSNA